MAIIHQNAQLSPSKPEILAAWVPSQPWSGDSTDLERIGAFRFDDPDGEVGIETHLLRTGDGRILQVPLTYRGAPLHDAQDSLVATLDHTVLGTRWVYDACADPAYLTALVAAIATGGGAAELVDAETGETTAGPVQIAGSGTPESPAPAIGRISHASDAKTTAVSAGGVEIELARVVGEHLELPAGPEVLTGTWPGRRSPALLAVVRHHDGRVRS
ncbi:CG0192-related protein [Rhodococcus zopfii]|uniref:CG0192-related protein n=1 Tax=Rhodococcus zopfii TaxID=43772 RepID=UPI001111305F|nr:hypothetical protein [Rhodococcus zopfii]